MSQISKCPKLRVVLGYWEALGEVSELRYKNLLYSSSKRSYCSTIPLNISINIAEEFHLYAATAYLANLAVLRGGGITPSREEGDRPKKAAGRREIGRKSSR